MNAPATSTPLRNPNGRAHPAWRRFGRLGLIALASGSLTGCFYSDPAWYAGQAVGRTVVQPVHPGFIGAHGVGQQLPTFIPQWQDHHSDTRRAIEDDWGH